MAEEEDQRTYCEICNKNFDEQAFDYRFDRPICFECGENLECDEHGWVLQMNLPNTPTQNYCERCGAVEEADPHDVAEQIRLLEEADKN